jgi:hypothetical protein
MEQQKFTQEELNQIKQAQTDYQTVGLDLVQIKLAILNAENHLEALKMEEKLLTERVLDINSQEKKLARELEQKYGKGEIDLDSGIFTPTS